MGSRLTKKKEEIITTLRPRFKIHVKVGGYHGSGTDSNVFIRLHDDKGQQSEDIKIDNKGKNKLQRGKTDVCCPELSAVTEHFSEVTRLELWGNHGDMFGRDCSWFCEVITIEDEVHGKEYPFPVLRWVKADYDYHMAVYDTRLPQDSIDPQRRQAELEAARQQYELDEKIPGAPLQVKEVPEDEHFTDSYKYLLVTIGSDLLLKNLSEKLKLGKTWESFDDFTTLYNHSNNKGYPFPKGLEKWQKYDKDEVFGAQRLVGVNPVEIKLATSIPDKFAVDEDTVKPFLEEQTLQEALEAKKIFLVDFNILNGIQNQNKDLEMCAPFGLFYLNKKNKLLPIAIQLYQDPSSDNPVFVPSDPEHTWSMAKMWFNMADASIHESLTHLNATHLAMEGFAVVTNRQLNISHPIYKLLGPHFLFLININSAALSTLIDEGGFIDQAMNIGRVGVIKLIGRRWNDWHLNVHGNPHEAFKERGVDDPAVLPVYPYRDDCLKVFDAIKKYVSDIINFYYDSPEKITADTELQSWGAELAGPRDGLKGLGVKGIPGDGKFTTVDEIILTCACIINTCSVQHAAVNFEQYDEYGFPANYPAYLKGSPPTSKDALTEKDLLDALADKNTLLLTMLVLSILSTRATYNLGSWEIRYQYQREALEAEDRFRDELRKISDSIETRNKSLDPLYQYTVLDPLSIPNAISI